MVCSRIGHLRFMCHGLLVSCDYTGRCRRLTSQSYLQYSPLSCFIVSTSTMRDTCTTLSEMMHAVQLTTSCAVMSWLGWSALISEIRFNLNLITITQFGISKCSGITRPMVSCGLPARNLVLASWNRSMGRA